MRTDPTDDGHVSRGRRREWTKQIGINDGRDDDGARAFALDVIRDETIAAGDDDRPTDQIVGLAEPLERAAQPPVPLADVAHVSRVVQIEYKRATLRALDEPFDERRPEQ